MKKISVVVCSIFLLCTLFTQAQQTISTTTDSIVPPLVNFGGSLIDASGKPMTGVVGVSFSLFKEQNGGSPLWMETQNVQPDETGHYSVMLGSTTSTGLPSSLFATGEAHWLAVHVEGQEEQPRILLVSAPYALKAGDAETIGGLPASAFMLANPAKQVNPTPLATTTTVPNSTANGVPPASITGSGTTNYIPKWTSGTAIGNSVLYQNGSGSTAKVGINTTAPAFTLDVAGQGRVLVSTTGNALLGSQTGTGTNGNGIEGLTSSTKGEGVLGSSTSTTGTGAGVMGTSSSASGFGLVGKGGIGIAGTSTLCCGTGGVEYPGGSFSGYTALTGSGHNGSDGVQGYGGNGSDADQVSDTGGNGVVGYGGTGKGEDNGTGGTGVVGVGGAGYGDIGDGPGGSFTGGAGTMGAGDGVDAAGGSGAGVTALGGVGETVTGAASGPDGIDAFPGNQGVGNYGDAGYFGGDVDITGTLTAATKDFKIDHPADPANKYLFHASVESSEMMNIYTGNVTTDGEGHAAVQMPTWFQALNTDFRYQLTAIGQFSQAIVETEINNNQFTIRTDKPKVKVSWQVTGVRQDAFAKAHPLVVEQSKPAYLRGFYIHPELFGAAANKSTSWGRNPNAMKRLNDMRARARGKMTAKARSTTAPTVN